MKFAVVVFPGSNCEADTYHVLESVLHQPVEYVWHATSGRDALAGYDCVVLPGGFAYGDYLRVGAIAAISPVMEAVAAHAERGGLVLGICNGFQILCEAGLLPGALRTNRQLEFVCADVTVTVESTATPFTARCELGRRLTIPVKHGEGCWVADDELFWVHMVQHELFIFAAPPLFLVGAAPFLKRNAADRRTWPGLVSRLVRPLTTPLIALGCSTAILWLWHVPRVYELALACEHVHRLEHVSFLGAYIMYWRPLMRPGGPFPVLPTSPSRVASGHTQRRHGEPASPATNCSWPSYW